MTPPDPRIEAIFHEALSRASSERAPFVAEACAGDESLQQEVRRLLAAHEEAGAYFDPPNSPEIEAELARLKPEEEGEIIGRYKLLQEIGQGGFGTVWMAEQMEPVSRRVALKIIKMGMDTREVIGRFEQERQALAMMDHTNIAKVFDAGATAFGRPYFVMELVKGIPITEFCDERQLDTRQRLELFGDVCSAINHAHQKGVIHRDIKPSNVMITLHGDKAVVKVIDFGIAKATQGKLTDKTLFTRFEQFIGTPVYMSPEQAGLSGLDIDTRSDIYALGILLYELLTGKPPFDAKSLASAGYEEMRRIIREVEPPMPSSRLSTVAGEERTALAKARKSTPEKLNRLVEPDLDWIVMKTLEKDRTRRYETANGLALDIGCFLRDEPISAGPPSLAYRLRKAVRRHRLAFAAGVTVAVSLLLGLTLAILGWREAGVERDAAVTAKEGEAAQRRVAEEAELGTRRRAYAAEISGAFVALAENNLGRARELLDRQRPKPGEEDLRGFEWRYLWKLCRSDELASFADGGTAGVSFSRDGRLLAYGGSRVMVRELAGRTVVAALEHKALGTAFSPQGSLLATSDDSKVLLWNTGNWTMERTLPGARDPVVFSPDGAWLVTGIQGGCQIWNTETWEPAGFCPGEPESLSRSVMRHAVVFSADGHRLFTPGHRQGINRNEFQVWEFPALILVDSFHRTPVPALWSAAFAPNGRNLLTGHFSGALCVWDLAEGKIAETLHEHRTGISAIAGRPGGAIFATASADHSLVIWDALRYRPLARLRGHLGEVSSMAISPDGTLLASGALDGTTKLWSMTTRFEALYLPNSRAIVGIAADSKSLLALPDDRTGLSPARRSIITRWSLHNKTTIETNHPDLAEMHWKTRWTKPAAFHPGGDLFALGRPNGVMELWDVTHTTRIADWQAAGGELLTSAFSQDGQYLAVGSADGTVSLWDHSGRRELKRFPEGGRGSRHLIFSSDGRWLACGGKEGTWVWDLNGGNPPLRLGTLPGEIIWLAFSPDSRLLATSAAGDNVTVLWDLPSGRRRTHLRGHLQTVDGLAFAPDGKTLATGGHDRQVKLWNVETGFEVATLSLDGACKSLQFSPDGKVLAVGYYRVTDGYRLGDGARIEIWQAPSWAEIADAENKAESSPTSGGTPPKTQ